MTLDTLFAHHLPPPTHHTHTHLGEALSSMTQKPEKRRRRRRKKKSHNLSHRKKNEIFAQITAHGRANFLAS